MTSSAWLEMNKENIKTFGFVIGILSGNLQAFNIGQKLEEFTKAVIISQEKDKAHDKDLKRIENKVDKNASQIFELYKKDK